MNTQFCNWKPSFSLPMSSNAEMEILNGQMARPRNIARRDNLRTWFIWLALCVLMIGVMFSFCIFSHHYHRVNDLCDAQATYDISSGDWKWNTTNCPGHLRWCNTSTVCINTDGVYLIDAQILVLSTDTTDMKLVTWPSSNLIIAGSYISPNNVSYNVLRANLVLKKEDKVQLIIHDAKLPITENSESTYWKILKLKG